MYETTSTEPLRALMRDITALHHNLDLTRERVVLNPEPLVDLVESEKQEKTRLTAESIGEVWEAIQGWREAHPGSLPWKNSSGDFEPRVFGELSVQFASDFDSAQAIAEQLRRAMSEFTRHIASNWEIEHRKIFRAHDEENLSARDRRFRRLMKLSHGTAHDPGDVKSEPISKPLERGFSTGLRFMWGSIGVIPEAFERDIGTRPDQNEMHQVMNTIPLLSKVMMNTHVSVFLAFENNARVGQNDFFHAEQFRIVTSAKDGQRVFSLAPDLITNLKIARKVVVDEPTLTGCPALYTPGKGSSRVIDSFTSWVLEVANGVMLPALFANKTRPEAANRAQSAVTY